MSATSNGILTYIHLHSFSDSLKILSEIRQNTILNTFLDALTRGGPGGLPRPIELHAHDPTRYVGDMLAWVHQAMAGEHEFLDGLFSVKNDNRLIGSVRKPKTGEEEGYVRQLLDTDLEKLCMPLKVRNGYLVAPFVDRLAETSRSKGQSPANRQVSRRKHHLVQNRQLATVLPPHSGENNQ